MERSCTNCAELVQTYTIQNHSYHEKILSDPRSFFCLTTIFSLFSSFTFLDTSINTNGLHLTFYQSPSSQQTINFEPGSLSNTNFYYATVQLKQSGTYQIQYESMFDLGTISMIRVWTESALYHYGSYASLEDPMGGNTLSKVDEYQGAALRMKLMNDCYTTHAVG